MGKTQALNSSARSYEPVAERIKHWREFVLPLPEADGANKARCMDCGIPFCHGTVTTTVRRTGCPVNNQIPDWNDLVYRGDWRLRATCTRPTTSRGHRPRCPTPCEASCTLNIEDNPVAIKTINAPSLIAPSSGADRAGAAVAQDRQESRGHRFGPGRMAARSSCARRHEVHLYEKFAKAGGLMRYGIP
jgi:glutamate synthase (NADPH/NADH) small chain